MGKKMGNAFIGKDCFNSVLKLEAYINPKCVTVVAGIEPRPAAPGANNATTRPPRPTTISYAIEFYFKHAIHC